MGDELEGIVPWQYSAAVTSTNERGLHSCTTGSDHGRDDNSRGND